MDQLLAKIQTYIQQWRWP